MMMRWVGGRLRMLICRCCGLPHEDHLLTVDLLHELGLLVRREHRRCLRMCIGRMCLLVRLMVACWVCG